MKLQCWEKDYHDMLEKAVTYKELSVIALDVLKKLPSPVGQVCGPISTGGAGSIEKNLKQFEQAIFNLQNRGLNIFQPNSF